LIREVRQEVNQKEEARLLQRLPKQEINDIRRSLMRTEIVPTGEAEFIPVPAESAFVPPQAPAPQPTPSFVDTATSTVSGAVDAVSGGAGNLLQRARTLAPGLLGDPKNQDIIDRANQPRQ